MKDQIGDRMKRYETNPRIVQRMPMIVRIDGRAFHTFTRGFEKPYSKVMQDAMQAVGVRLMQEIQGSVFAYGQSDEVSIVAIDYKGLESEHWFGGKVQKICSIAASAATLAFDNVIRECDDAHAGTAMFDARVFSIPEADLGNYLLWRARDARRNFIQTVARMQFGHSKIQGKSTVELNTELLQYPDALDYPRSFKNGWLVRHTHDYTNHLKLHIESCDPKIAEPEGAHSIVKEELSIYLEHE